MTSPQLQQLSKDIEAARKNPPCDPSLMTLMLRNGPDELARLNKMRDIIEKEPLFDKSQIPFLSRQEYLAYSIKVHVRLLEILDEQNLSLDEFAQLYLATDIVTPLQLNYGAFIPVIVSQGTDEQQAKWLAAAARHAIIGCYAQTELSHGSNVARLQTTATFDEKTDEFVINSPDLTAAKWWIGGLGVVSTHAVLQAQLIIKGKNYGPHIFIVPIRSPIDHTPVKGVTVGDIGPKAYGGFATTDNGFALFDHVRIPRDNMLMRFAQVSADGTYTPPVHSKLSYGSMVKLRVGIVTDAGWKLARATTIATRYCTVRRQFNLNDPKELESQVISYSSVQHRLLPLISSAYALIIAGQNLSDIFDVMTAQLANQDASLLPEIHVTSCAFKVWGARRGSEGLEESRKAMGGHGFSIFSGVADLFATFVPANTYEGDNFVLVQQVGRALLKQVSFLASGKPLTLKSASYLESLKQGTDATYALKETITNDALLEMYGIRAARLVAELAKEAQSGRAWEDLNMECWNVSFAHAEYHLLKEMLLKVKSIEQSREYAPLASTLAKLAHLFGLSTLCKEGLATFLCTSTISPADSQRLQAAYRAAIADLAPGAVPLTDAFGFNDRELNSALGRADGRAYEALWEAVQKNPVNQEQGRKEFAALIQQILHRGDNLAYIKSAKL